MRGPAEEHQPALALLGASQLGEHRLLAGGHQLPVAEAEPVGVDHLLDRLVGRRAGADPVEFAIEALRLPGEVLEAMDTGIPDVAWHRQGEASAVEVAPQALDLAAGDEPLMVVLVRRHPAAEEGVHLAIAQAAVDDRHRQGLDLHPVAQAFQEEGGAGIGHRDIAPARIGEPDAGTGGVFGMQRGTAQEQRGGQQASGEPVHGRCPRAQGCGKRARRSRSSRSIWLRMYCWLASTHG